MVSFSETYKKVKPSVVAIVAKISQRPDFPDIIGTGFIAHGDGIVVTNNHVIEAINKLPRKKDAADDDWPIRVMYLHDMPGKGVGQLFFEVEGVGTLGREKPVEGYHYGADIPDIGLVYLKARGLPHLEVEDHFDLEEGDEVFISGYPLGTKTLRAPGWIHQINPVLQRGIVSAIQPFPCEKPHGLLIDAMVQGGSSGSPIFNPTTGKVTALLYILIPSERQLGSELRVSQWTMLGKLMRLVYENYVTKFADEQALKEKFAETIKPAKDFLEDDFTADEVTYKKFVDTFKKYCKENSAGLANEFDPVLDIYNLNWFYKTLQIHVKEKFPDRHFDSDEVGAGMQNLLLISIFQTYSELMGGKVIFGIEEPEIYLYPQAQRALYKNFIKLSENTQIFYTTHNPNFVDAVRPEDLLLLRKNKDDGTYALEKDSTFTTENAEKHKYRIYTHFNPERNELFFARKVLLIEGDSDKILFSTLCEKRWDIDIDELGISIISCGGKGGVLYFIGVCKLIGFEDYFAVWDKDEALDNPALLDETKTAGKGLEIDPNLEGFLGLAQGDDADKIRNAHEWASDETKDVPDEFDVVKDFLVPKSANAEVESTKAIDPDDIPF